MFHTLDWYNTHIKEKETSCRQNENQWIQVSPVNYISGAHTCVCSYKRSSHDRNRTGQLITAAFIKMTQAGNNDRLGLFSADDPSTFGAPTSPSTGQYVCVCVGLSVCLRVMKEYVGQCNG